MFDKTVILHELRRKELMRTASNERLAKALQPARRPAASAFLSWTGRRLVEAGRRMQLLADALGSEPTVAVRSRTL